MKKIISNLLNVIFLFYMPISWGIDQINLSVPIQTSTQIPDFNGTYKSKIESVDNGILVVVYGDYTENDPQKYVFDSKANNERPARDVFITTCDSVSKDCSIATNWSPPINLSNTAQLTSIQTDWNGDGNRIAYYGDSDNPHMFSSGNHVVVSWGDKYCAGGQQRSVTYLEFDSREIPMSCLYVAHATNSFDQLSDWTVNRLSDGSRDVKQDNIKGLSSGVWAITWQEDPLGLQPGEAEGPGEGSSGAKVSHGTDIWYSFTANIASAVSDIGVWSTPVRITDNQTGFGLSGSFNPIKDTAGNSVNPAQIDKGISGASRANLQVVGGSSPPNTVIAYEETKGSAGLDEGKFLRYHVFPYNSPPATAAEKAGCIVSDPAENARRARFVAQTNAASGSGIRFALFWRQGEYDQGGPADIMLRIGYKSADAGSTGLNPADLNPPVDPNCFALDYASAISLANNPPLNISSNTYNATDENLADSSGENYLENARAHRAVLRANDLYLGYIYTDDGVVAAATDLANYNFFVRRFNASTSVWGKPVNLSNITDTAINVLEPRLMGTPGNQPGCTDPTNITNAENCQNKSVVLAAWGTETNVYEHIGGSENLDVYITRTTDKAAHWEPVSNLASGPNQQGESQFRITPDGNRIFAVWNEASAGATNSMFSLGTPVTLSSDMAVAVSSIPATVYAGSNIDINYIVENSGPDKAYDIKLVIDLPSSVQFLSADDSCVHDAGTVTCQLGDMAINDSVPIGISVKSTSVEALTFTATIESDVLGDPDASNNQVQSIVNATMASDVGVMVSSNSTSVDVGSDTSVSYQLNNDGPSQADSVTLTIPLPAGASYVSASPDICNEASGEVSCNVGTLTSGGSTLVTVNFQINVSGQTVFNATSSANQFDPVIDNNQASIEIAGVPHADLAVFINSSRDTLKEGRHTTINVGVMNYGPQVASGAVVTINAPTDWAQISLASAEGSCRISGSSYICDVGDLDVGSTSTISLTGTVDDVTNATFKADVSAEVDDPDVTNNEAMVVVIFTSEKTTIETFFGCSLANNVNSKTMFDPTLPILLLISFYKIGKRGSRHRST